MGDSNSADQIFHPAESRMRGIRRVWKWGIVFWIVAWIYSALVVQLGFTFYLAGYEVELGVSSGSIYADFVRSPAFSGIEWINPQFVFSEHRGQRYMSSPEDMLRMLGRVGLPRSGYKNTFAFPIAGVLWFWLLLGWTDGFKKFAWLISVRSPRILARIFILLGLPLLIGVVEYRVRKNDEMVSCIMMMRNIQQAVRGHQGMNNLHGALDWNDIFGPSGYLPQKSSKCPSGLPYRLSENIPDMGVLAAECQNPEHLKSIKAQAKRDHW